MGFGIESIFKLLFIGKQKSNLGLIIEANEDNHKMPFLVNASALGASGLPHETNKKTKI
jgi:hypothetical protein